MPPRDTSFVLLATVEAKHAAETEGLKLLLMGDHADAARFEEEVETVDQDTAPKELFYTEGTPALREARLQACCPSPTLLGPLPCVSQICTETHGLACGVC